MISIYVITRMNRVPYFVKATDEDDAAKKYLKTFNRHTQEQILKDKTFLCRMLTLEMLDKLAPEQFQLEEV